MYMQIRHAFLILSVLSGFLLSACTGAQTPTSTPASPAAGAQPTQAPAGYPVPEAANSAPYPYPQSTFPNPYPGGYETALVATAGPVPAPGKDTGVVIGRFLGDNKPVTNAILYLAEVKKAENGQEMLAAYSEIDSPRAYTDANGDFVFPNIPPGKYGLVLNTIVAEYLLHEPKKSGTDLLFVVEAGKTLDLGDLAYTGLPTE